MAGVSAHNTMVIKKAHITVSLFASVYRNDCRLVLPTTAYADAN